MWNPKDYAKNSDAQLNWARSLLKRINLADYSSILDVGCGDGKITANLANNLPHARVIGVDSSPEMVAYAAQKYTSDRYPNLSFNCVDARYLNFQSEFDLVFSNATLHWVDDHPGFLKGANTALKNGGRLIISCGGKGNAAQILDTFARLITTDDWQAYFQNFNNPYFFYGLEDYRRWLEQSGFIVKRLELVPKDMTHRGKEKLGGWIRTTWMPFTRCIPEARRDRFIEQFLDLYLAQNPLDRKGFSHVSMVRLEVDASKSR